MRSLFNPFAVPALHLLSPFLANQPSPPWKSQIAHSDMHHPVSGINSLIIPSASPVMSRLTSSNHLSAHLCHRHHSHHPSPLHSFTPDSKPTFLTNLPTSILLLPRTAFMITGPDRTYHASRFILSSFFSLIFLFLPCGGLSWLHISFLLHV